jgi:hypothetical protein
VPPPLGPEAPVNARGVAAAALRRLREATRGRPEPARPERNPDERPRLDSLDDWILFGPRMR